MTLPCGVMIRMPPGPEAQTLPAESTFSPSGTPAPMASVKLMKLRPPETAPSAATSNALICICGKLFDT
jgi:hypothetical protein